MNESVKRKVGGECKGGGFKRFGGERGGPTDEEGRSAGQWREREKEGSGRLRVEEQQAMIGPNP